MKIQTRWALPDNYHCSARHSRAIQYLVLHDAAGESAAACAAQLSTKALTKSVHFIVDAQGVWQTVQEHDVAWHCGTRSTYFHSKCRNENSLGIALCGDEANGRRLILPQTQARAAALINLLVKRYQMKPTQVLRDYDVTHRCCPRIFVEQASTWREFIRQLYSG